MTTPGVFYVVATPIGNLQDISQRALQTLHGASMIFAEDCRHSKKLLFAYGINTPMQSLHAHNEAAKLDTILELLNQGKDVAAITDAGTPLISDPGQYTVKALREAGITITPIPGACALTTALSAAGLPCSHFIFEGFLSVKNGVRKKQLQALLHEPRTLIFYEAPHRILDFLQAAREVFGEARHMVIARELTKIFESFITGTIADCLATIESSKEHQLGEFVIMITGNDTPTDPETPTVDVDALLKCLSQHTSVKQAATEAAHLTGLKKNALYQRLLALRS